MTTCVKINLFGNNTYQPILPLFDYISTMRETDYYMWEEDFLVLYFEDAEDAIIFKLKFGL